MYIRSIIDDARHANILNILKKNSTWKKRHLYSPYVYMLPYKLVDNIKQQDKKTFFFFQKKKKKKLSPTL